MQQFYISEGRLVILVISNCGNLRPQKACPVDRTLTVVASGSN